MPKQPKVQREIFPYIPTRPEWAQVLPLFAKAREHAMREHGTMGEGIQFIGRDTEGNFWFQARGVAVFIVNG